MSDLRLSSCQRLMAGSCFKHCREVAMKAFVGAVAVVALLYGERPPDLS